MTRKPALAHSQPHLDASPARPPVAASQPRPAAPPSWSAARFRPRALLRKIRLRSLLFYPDLAHTLLICLRLLALPERRPVALGFFINKEEGQFLPAGVCPEAAFIRVNYPRHGRGWRAHRFEWLLRLLARMTKGRRVSAIVWGTRDSINHGVDVARYFPDLHRIEAALIRGAADAPHGAHTSFVVGAGALYFDGRTSTDLEEKLNRLVPGELPRTEAGRHMLAHVLGSNLTKYALEEQQAHGVSSNDLVIVGQCTGDQAIVETETLGRSNPELIELAMRHVLERKSHSHVYFKPHPKNRTTPEDLFYIQNRYPRIRIIDAKASIVPVLAARPAVATLTSGVGLEAALRGCEVHCFGISFYSNWGFTTDYLACPRRRNSLSPEDVFLCMVMEQTVYVDWRKRRRISALEAFGLA